MKNYTKIIFIVFAFLILILLIFFIRQTYAKYISSLDGSASVTISRWNITVNNQSIKNNPDISSKIVPVFPGNDNIASNVIAPTAEGYFDLHFDFTNVDVSFKYEISVSADETSAVSDLVATGYIVDNGTRIDFTNFNELISDTISLNDNIQSRDIRVFVMWDDNSETQTMDNIADTTSTMVNNINAILKVTISLTQIAN